MARSKCETSRAQCDVGFWGCCQWLGQSSLWCRAELGPNTQENTAPPLAWTILKEIFLSQFEPLSSEESCNILKAQRANSLNIKSCFLMSHLIACPFYTSCDVTPKGTKKQADPCSALLLKCKDAIRQFSQNWTCFFCKHKFLLLWQWNTIIIYFL